MNCPHHARKRSLNGCCPFCGARKPTESPSSDEGTVIATFRYDPLTGGLHLLESVQTPTPRNK